MKINLLRLVFGAAILVVLGVLWQAFSIVAYIRSGEDGWLDAHGTGSLFVHIGQLGIVIGTIAVAWGRWRVVGIAVLFLVLSVVQLAALGDTEESGSWVNGFHGMLALVVMLAALGYWSWAKNQLDGRPPIVNQGTGSSDL